MIPIAWVTFVAFFLAACRTAARADRVRPREAAPATSASERPGSRARDLSARRGDAFPRCPRAPGCAARARSPRAGERRWVQLRRL